MSKKLIVSGDDFGMCHSINMGIVESFNNGILTQAGLMAPCPWFEEAAALAHKHSIPAGVHLTVTCDWDMFRWRPLTKAPTLVGKDGCFYSTIKELQEHADPIELQAELEAQINLIKERGLNPVFLESHMGISDQGIAAKLCKKHNLISRDPVEPLDEEYSECMFQYDSFYPYYDKNLAGITTDKKIEEIKKYIQNLKDGIHSLSGNPAVASAEMESVCSGGVPKRTKDWALNFRVSFLELFTAPEIRQACRDNNVELVPLEKVLQ